MSIKQAIIAKFDKWFPPIPAAPKPAKKRPRQAAPRPAKQATAPAVSYDDWKRGKTGHGPKVAAPRGYGQEWAARLYCENAISRANYYADGNRRSKRQLRTGSREYRRQKSRNVAHGDAWRAGLEIAEATYNRALELHTEYPTYWPGVKDIVKECFEYSHYLHELAGD